MDGTLINLDYSIHMKARRTHIIASYFHTPGETERRLFHAVLRAGHIKTAADYRIERSSYPGHDWLFCITGAGFVRSGERAFPISAGQLGWLDCSRPHAHWPDAANPWELLWLRVDSPQMNLLAEALKVRDSPVFTLRDSTNAITLFEQIFKLLRERPLTLDVSLHAAISNLTELLFVTRQDDPAYRREARVSARFRGVLAQMRLDCKRAWKIEDFARLAGVSVPHFFRCFNKATGASPMDWLRRERINQAKRLLSETDELIRVIAEQVGYRDPFYFSRDFRKLVGVSPRLYRKQEQARTTLK